MKRLYKIAICTSLLATFVSCKDSKKIVTPVTQQEVSFKKEGELSIFRNDSLLKTIDIEIADNDYETETGLMYRKSMLDNRGMLFVFDDEEYRFFYMKNTEFPLDIIYLDKDKKIITIAKNTNPLDESSVPSDAPAMYVLEINAGLSDKWNLAVGDSVNYTKTN